jgi:hypothetical protein
MIREEVYKLIDGERDYQNTKWSSPPDLLHTPTEFILYIDDYVRQGISQATRNTNPEATQICLDTIRKIAALAVACMEQHETQARAIVKKDYPSCDYSSVASDGYC